MPQERTIDVEYDSNAHFISFDTIINWNGYSFQPYVGLLHDTTPANRRFSAYPVLVNEDNLGAVGFDTDLNLDKLNVGIEVARNFGNANVLGLSPAPHYDGNADPAYQIELATEITF